MDELYIENLTHNLGASGGGTVTLGRVTCLLGPVRSGKTTIVRALSLLAGGVAVDVQGRDTVKSQRMLQWLTADGSAPEITATLSDGTEVHFRDGQSSLEGAVLAFDHARDALCGSEESAAAFLGPYLDMYATKETALLSLPEQYHQDYEVAEWNAAGSGPMAVLLDMYQAADESMRSLNKEVRAAEARLKREMDRLGHGAADPEEVRKQIREERAALDRVNEQIGALRAEQTAKEKQETAKEKQGPAVPMPSQEEVDDLEKKWRSRLTAMEEAQGVAARAQQEAREAEVDIERHTRALEDVQRRIAERPAREHEQRAYVQAITHMLNAAKAMSPGAHSGAITTCAVCGSPHPPGSLYAKLQQQIQGYEQGLTQLRSQLEEADRLKAQAQEIEAQVQNQRTRYQSAKVTYTQAMHNVKAHREIGTTLYQEWERRVQARKDAQARETEETEETEETAETKETDGHGLDALQEQRDALQTRIQQLEKRLSLALTSEATREEVRRLQREITENKERSQRAKALKQATKDARRAVSKHAAASLEEAVNELMPDTLDGRPIRFGLDPRLTWGLRVNGAPEGAVNPVLSGGEWVVTLSALACLLAQRHRLVLILPEERGMNGEALSEYFGAMLAAPPNVQVVFTTPVKPKGRKPTGLTLIKLDP